MKIALCQSHILWEQKSENIKRAERWMKAGKEQGAQLVCFPEMSFTGFSMNTQLTGEKAGETIKLMQELAEKYRIATGFGWVEQGPEKAKNHYTVVDEEGRVLTDYVKIHPFSYSLEDQYFAPGLELKTFQYKDLRIGVLICYDLRFPEPFQVLAQTCDLILVPANWPAVRREHYKCLLQARAIECQTYLAGINCWGTQKEIKYAGDSCVFTPDGVRSCGFGVGETLLMAEIPGDKQSYRSLFPARQDRKWRMYDEWYQDIVETASL